ncbi:hypothetical protein CDL15_Pgr021163 [Punica granatum]|uniref:PPM-type phosphatase domain-containing protein n=1 Tax=Punica granatum TaxID=22663 RepID=A0A218WJ50_PUNGR|nr:hypothetical protein CDL15_Pgr021163 [Punica granatum]
MCVQDAEEMEGPDPEKKGSSSPKSPSWPLHCEFLDSQMGNWGSDEDDDKKNKSSSQSSSAVAASNESTLGSSFPIESISEDCMASEKKQIAAPNFVPKLRSGEWSDIGDRPHMEDTHICIVDLAERSLLVANAGDCRAVLSRRGVAVEMSRDHRPCCTREKTRIESLGGFIVDDYLNGQLGVTRALGDWHLEGMKRRGEGLGPLSSEPELNLTTVVKEDEFLIIGSDGMWDVFSSQNAVDFARRRLQEHNDVKLCCKQIVEEAIKRGARDNLTVVIVSFHHERPPQLVVQKARFRRSISAEGLQSIKCLLDG